MNKIFFLVGLLFLMFSCSKSDLQKTNDTISQASDAIKTAQEGFKTLDSISAIVQDTANMRKIISPEIEKHQESIEKILKNKSLNSDSIQKIINDVKTQLGENKEVSKTIDSISNSLKNAKNPLEAIEKISKNFDKISAIPDTIVSTFPKNNSTKSSKNNNPTPPEIYSTYTEPIQKYGNLEFDIADIHSSTLQISGFLKNYNGILISEQINEQEGIKKQKMTFQFPLKNFDQAVEGISNLAISNVTKVVQSSGSNYDGEQLCTLQITMVENSALAGSGSFGKDDALTSSVDEMPKGMWDSLKKYGTYIIGFVLLFLMIILVLFIWILRKLSKKEADKKLMKTEAVESEIKMEQPQLYSEKTENTNTSIETDPYEKYKPKPKF